MLNQTDNTKAFLADMRRLARRPDSSEDRKKYLNRNIPSSIEKLYTGDTDKFEPIPENREHLINTMIPMIYSIARRISGQFGSRVELDDCINSGTIGATIATDRYIAKSAKEKQEAKLSSYAYSYIEKYISEHCRSTNSIISHGTTQWIDAASHHVNSGNDVYGDGDGKQVEFFDMAPSELLIDNQDTELAERMKQASKYVSKLFSQLDVEEKQILMMRFGIQSSNEMSFKDIAKKTNCRTSTVETKFAEIISKLQTVFTDPKEIQEVISVLRNTNINTLI